MYTGRRSSPVCAVLLTNALVQLREYSVINCVCTGYVGVEIVGSVASVLG